MIAKQTSDENNIELNRMHLLVRMESTTPTPTQIRHECERIQKGWNEREKALRRLRSQMACRFGICRNL